MSMENVARQLVKEISAQAPKRVVMKWKGSKVSRGATIGGIEIAWTQHGRILGNDHRELGHYQRAVEFGGTNGDEHEIVCAVDDVEVIAPDGTICREQP